MKISSIIIALLISINIYGQSDKDLLQLALKRDSGQLFVQILNGWSNKTQPPIESTQYQNDTLREVYNIFESFFIPANFDTIDGTSLSQLNYRNHNYILVQNAIKIYFADQVYYTDEERDSLGVEYSIKTRMQTKLHESEYDFFRRQYGKMPLELIRYNGETKITQLDNSKLINTISDFRPRIECRDKKAIYLTEDINKVINAYLGNKYVQNDSKSFTLSTNKENVMRKKTLDQFVKFWYGQTGAYWHLVTYPLVESVTFDKNMSFARLKIRLPYLGAIMILKKEDDKWRVVSCVRKSI